MKVELTDSKSFKTLVTESVEISEITKEIWWPCFCKQGSFNRLSYIQACNFTTLYKYTIRFVNHEDDYQDPFVK